MIERLEQYLVEKLGTEPTGHDFYHLSRVRDNALLIAKDYDVDFTLVEVAALVHDVIDHKLVIDIDQASTELKSKLVELGYENYLEQVFEIIDNISYSKGNVPTSLEGKIIQDADRLDAIGAIGIARAFAYGGNKNRMIYDPKGDNKDHSIQHFYDKLLLIQDKMNTESGKRLAIDRTEYMKGFLEQFYKEWK